MGCFAVFYNGKQIRVFYYQSGDKLDWKRAFKKAHEIVVINERAGYIGYEIEDFPDHGNWHSYAAYTNGTMSPAYKNLLDWS